MSHPSPAPGLTDERRELADLGPRIFKIALAVGVLGLVLAIVLTFAFVQEHALRTFGLAYLSGIATFLGISLAALFFVIIQHLTRAGWSVTVRRLAELMSVNLITLAILAIPLLLLILPVYEHWAHPHEFDPVVDAKSAWLNIPFFILRVVLYFAVWVGLARWFFTRSLAQDSTGDRGLTEQPQAWAGLAIVLFALTVTFASFDLLMSLDPHWYSTVFGVYFFSGGMIGFFASMVLTLRFLQKRGILTHSITTEHYHDLGKWLFAFVFFWGYIAYSQYMLMWYGNIPEEIAWYALRGAATHPAVPSHGWQYIALALLFGHLFIPFAGLLSRIAKRGLGLLAFWAAWMMIFHSIDLAWLTMPEAQHGMVLPMILAMLCTIGIGGFWVAGLAKLAAGRSLVPLKDPRLDEALAFENY